MNQVALQAGDVVLVRSKSFLGRLIRWATRSPGEAKSVVNHVGVMVSSTEIVESQATTVQRKFMPTEGTWVMRRKGLLPSEQKAIQEKALSYVGRKYGWLKIAAHAVDRLLFKSRYVARRLLFLDNYPICSWVVAYAYDAAGLSFGVPADKADPDDIWDAIFEKPTKAAWDIVYPPGTP